MKQFQLIISKFILLILLASITQVQSTKTNTYEELLANPNYFQDEICSFNGVRSPASTPSYIKCDCNINYTNDPNQKLRINGIPIQCSYAKKRKFIALFLAIYVPFGIDQIYIGNYIAFGCIFLFGLCTIIGNMYRFIISPEDDYLKNKTNLTFFVLIFIFLAIWIGDVLFIYFYSKDVGGNPLVDDVYLLFN